MKHIMIMYAVIFCLVLSAGAGTTWYVSLNSAAADYIWAKLMIQILLIITQLPAVVQAGW